MEPFKEGKLLYTDNVKVAVRYLAFIEKLKSQGKHIDASDTLRMYEVE